jgi:hypothetical protein
MIGSTASILALALTLGAASTPATPKPLTSRDRRSNVHIAIYGAAIFAVSYGAATGLAAAELDDTRHAEDTPGTRDRRRVAHLMFVPVFGPLVATPLGPTKSDRAGLAGFGILQTFGLALLGAATFSLARDRRARRAQGLAFGGALGPGGGMLTVRGRF